MLDISPKLTTAPFAGASTLGWDTVFGITFDRVNQTITKEGSYPPDFNQLDPSGDSLVGTFSGWALTGGSGPKLHVTLSVPQLTLDLGTPILRREVSITIEAQLDKFPTALGRGYPKGATAVAFRIANSNLADEPVMVTDVSYPELPPETGFPGQPASTDDGLTPTDIQDLFFDWINDSKNLAKFTATFATVNLNTRAAVDAWKWLDPSFATYAVQKTGGTGGGVLAVLCMTGDRPEPSTWEVTADLIPPGAEAGFLLSKEMFLTQMLMPGLGLMFDDPGEAGKAWPTDYFRISDGGTKIENTTALGIERFDIEGKEYEASIEPGQFTAKLHDTYLALDMKRFCHDFAKGWYNVFHDIVLPCQLQLSADRKQLLLCPGSGELDPDGNDLNPPTHDATIEKTPLAVGIEWTIAVIDLLLVLYSVGKFASSACRTSAAKPKPNVATGGADVPINPSQSMEAGARLSTGSAPVISEGMNGATKAADWGVRAYGSAFFGVLGAAAGIENVAQLVMNWSESGKASIPDISIFADKVMEPVVWPEQSGFDLSSVEFNGGVQIGGTPVFADNQT